AGGLRPGGRREGEHRRRGGAQDQRFQAHRSAPL
ncbi:MAG: hypothetical protein AVDCRST_MAG91-3630, partial [uncultured Sphingomonadaceae bacterium]